MPKSKLENLRRERLETEYKIENIDPKAELEFLTLDSWKKYEEKRQIEAEQELTRQIQDELEEACKQKAVVTAATWESKNHMGSDSVVIVGLNQIHEYTVLDTERMKINGCEHCFIKLRNPHGAVGRTYVLKDGQLHAKANNDIKNSVNAGDNGITYVELKDFNKEFQTCSIGKVKESSAERSNRLAADEKKVLNSYKKSFQDIKAYLDSAKRRWSGDSDEYQKLYGNLQGMLDDFPSNYVELKNRMNELKGFIEKYNEHTVRSSKDNFRRNRKKNACTAMTELINEADGLRRPDQALVNLAAGKILQDFANHGYPKADASSQSRLEPMRQQVITAPKDAKRWLMKLPEFQKWCAKHDYMSMREAIKHGVTLQDIQFKVPGSDKLPDRIMKTVADLRKERKIQGPDQKTAQAAFEKRKASDRLKRQEAQKNKKVQQGEIRFR